MLKKNATLSGVLLAWFVWTACMYFVTPYFTSLLLCIIDWLLLIAMSTESVLIIKKELGQSRSSDGECYVFAALYLIFFVLLLIRTIKLTGIYFGW